MVISFSTAVPAIAPHAEVKVGSAAGRVAWAPSSQWIFYAGTQDTIRAYRPGEKAPTDLKVPNSGPFIATSK